MRISDSLVHLNTQPYLKAEVAKLGGAKLTQGGCNNT